MVVKQLNSSYFWSPVEKTDFSIGVVIPVTHVNEVLNTLQIPKGKDGFSLTSSTHHRPAILLLSPKDSPSLKARYQLIVSCDGVCVCVGGGAGLPRLVLIVHCHKRMFASIDSGYSFKYHRIDLDPPQHPCLHFGNIVTSGEYN